MENTNSEQNQNLSIMDYVRSAKLKGEVDIGVYWFTWDLGGVYLRFTVFDNETDVSYFGDKVGEEPIGTLHKDNAELIQFIEEINDENKMVEIVKYFFGICTSFSVVDKSCGKKKSSLFARRYYSC